MIEDVSGAIDYDESGSGPTLVLVPGSCSTGRAWRSVISEFNGRFRCVTTSLLGYGGTAERRTINETSIVLEAEALEAVIRQAAGPVHLVGHSFGGLVALVVALRRRAPLASLTILEAPAAEILRAQNDPYYLVFREMTDSYFAAFRNGEPNAIEEMIDFYGGQGTFMSWPSRVRGYAIETTPVNILDWESAYGFSLSKATLGSIRIPVLIAWGSDSQPAVQSANKLLGAFIPGAACVSIRDAAHFMIATHAYETATLIARQVLKAERLLAATG